MTRVEDLRQRLEAAYAAIREIDEDLGAGRISAADHAELKARSEREAARLLKRLGDAEREERSARAAAPPRGALGAQLKSPLALTFAAVLILVVGLGVGILLGRSTSDAPGGAPAGPSTAPGAGAAGAGVSTELEALRREVEPETTPTKKLLAFGHVALDEGQTPAAILAYKRVLAREPKNVEAMTHMGIILYQGNHVEQALARIGEALAVDPNYAHAHWDRAQILFHGKKDYPAAVRALEAFLALVPTGDDADRARALLAEARARAAAPARRGEASPPGTGSPSTPAGGASVMPAGSRPVVVAAQEPLPAERFTGKAAQAYRVAREIGDTLAQLTCYCGCDVTAGHRNLRACFLDDHAAT